jgi:diadenosine tetraphosphatase ApaH/serine/threonine PP2A family protein phosphatase
MTFDLDRVIAIIESGGEVPEADALTLIRKTMEVLLCEGNLLELQSPITICGDTHGQLYDVFKLFEESGPKDSQTFLFLGDYVDRGYYSLETIFYFLALKLRYPGQFYLLRGNHECRQINQLYGFYVECQTRYRHGGIWMLCNELFDVFPIAAIIDHRVFAVHGGLSPDLPVVEKVSLLFRNEELPTSGPLCDLCWSDPDSTTTEWRMNMRGAGYLFGDRQAKAFCHLNGDLDFVARSHQLAELGFAWNFDRRVVTVWSAPNYMYRSGNKASLMKYRKEDGREPVMVVFEAMAAERRKVPWEEPPEQYFV